MKLCLKCNTYYRGDASKSFMHGNSDHPPSSDNADSGHRARATLCTSAPWKSVGDIRHMGSLPTGIDNMSARGIFQVDLIIRYYFYFRHEDRGQMKKQPKGAF